LEDDSVSDGAKITYCKILRLADKAGCCEAINKKLDGTETGNTASRHIKELIKAGYLESKMEVKADIGYQRKLWICQK